MAYIANASYALLVVVLSSILLIWPTSARGMDFNGDGLSNVFVYSESKSAVFVFSGSEGLVGEVPLGPNVQQGTLFPVMHQGKAHIASLRTNGRLQLIGHEGNILGNIEIGELDNRYLFFFDVDGSGFLDVISLNRRGAGQIRFNPFGPNRRSQPLRVRAPRGAILTFAYTDAGLPAIAAFAPQNRGARQLVVKTEISTGRVMRKRMPGRLFVQPETFPQHLPSSFMLSRYLNNGRTQLRIFVPERRRPFRMALPPGRAAIPGVFVPHSAPQLAILGNGYLDIVDARNRDSLARIEVNSDFQSGGDGGGSNCSMTPAIQSLINQAINAAQAGNYAALQNVIDQLMSLNLCQQQIEAIFSQLAPFFGPMFAFTEPPQTSAALFEGQAFLLAQPSYASGVPEANGKNRAGCDSTRRINNGAVLKNGDHTGRVTFLTPAGVYPSSCSIIRRNGNVVERLQFSGIANGGRAHFRGQKPQRGYPRNATIRCEVARAFQSQMLCWETNNFHVRNS